MKYKILVINPGSTSTKLAVFENKDRIIEENISHTEEEMEKFPTIVDQTKMRYSHIMDFLRKHNINIQSLSAVVGRGGLLKPLPGGTYNINQKMIDTVKSQKYGKHASNLGALLAKRIADTAAIPSFIVDPVVVDEMSEIAKITGIPELKNRSIFHALNQREVARNHAEMTGNDYKDMHLIVAHLGGGISVGIHIDGKIVDVNNALGGLGPMSPNRAGSLPAVDLLNLMKKENYSFEEMEKKIVGDGGLKAHLGTADLIKVEEMIRNGNKQAELVLSAMSYQIIKEIASLAVVNAGEIDAIILTGGMSHSKYLTEKIIKKIKFIAPVYLYPGEKEMEALAAGAFRVLSGEEKAKDYH
ncbi:MULTISPECIES: butyrate kinase [unclassified Halanaerobium]|uniref:butyrate kinase n=1 Tax=unclassified Halanaerobium TaxID=2641197 RepID=UPI000DF4C032|nr:MULTISPECIES: butyrate kinase [unclassified Halanaerobium]RCW50560.1 butyrate kinase [Halanaerobium sp. MA284_MarDTE_T2]RCW82172.1 butyrate kinase [Halanaerobium sp. DL-01]